MAGNGISEHFKSLLAISVLIVSNWICHVELMRLLIFDIFVSRNIMTLIDGFNLPEDSISQSNYEEALNHLNSSSPDTVLGLDIKTCDMQKLLSEVSAVDQYLKRSP